MLCSLSVTAKHQETARGQSAGVSVSLYPSLALVVLYKYVFTLALFTQECLSFQGARCEEQKCRKGRRLPTTF